MAEDDDFDGPDSNDDDDWHTVEQIPIDDIVIMRQWQDDPRRDLVRVLRLHYLVRFICRLLDEAERIACTDWKAGRPWDAGWTELEVVEDTPSSTMAAEKLAESNLDYLDSVIMAVSTEAAAIRDVPVTKEAALVLDALQLDLEVHCDDYAGAVIRARTIMRSHLSIVGAKLFDAGFYTHPLEAEDPLPDRWSVGATLKTWARWFAKAGHPLTEDDLIRCVIMGQYRKHPNCRTGYLRLDKDTLPPAMRADDFWKAVGTE